MHRLGVEYALSEVFAKGGEGGVALAQKVLKACEQSSAFHCLYETDRPIREKIETIAREIYGADGVALTAQAEKQLREIEALGQSNLPVCMAKTQYSLSDNPALLGSLRLYNYGEAAFPLRWRRFYRRADG